MHYMGSTVLNPSTTECARLEVHMSVPNLLPNVPCEKPVMYPSKEEIEELNKEVSTPGVSADLVFCFGGSAVLCRISPQRDIVSQSKEGGPNSFKSS